MNLSSVSLPADSCVLYVSPIIGRTQIQVLSVWISRSCVLSGMSLKDVMNAGLVHQSFSIYMAVILTGRISVCTASVNG